MIKNYFKVAWRNLWKNKGFSLINIIGLAISMCGAILIFSWIMYEVSYDDFHVNKDNLYKVWNRSFPQDGPVNTWPVTSSKVAPELKRLYPEVAGTARVYWPNNRLFNYADKRIVATGLDVDPQLLNLFTFKMLSGNSSALNDPSGIILTRSLAQKIFGTTDVLNKVVKVDNANNYKVTGVTVDPPGNSEFKFDFLLSITPLIGKFESDTWGNASFNTYVLLKPGTNADEFNKKLLGLMTRHDAGLHFDMFLHPLSKWHLYSRFDNGKAVGGAIETVRLLIVIAVLILIIACINFMNLSTAQSERRSREVGVRKVMGAGRFSLIAQFLIESILITFIAGVIAFVLAQLLLPSFNKLTDNTLVINYSNPYMWLAGLAFVILTGLLAGSYPAFYLSSFRPVRVLKGIYKGKLQVLTPRKLLVITQFTVAIVLSIATLVIYSQIQFVQNRNAGYVRNNLVEHPMSGTVSQNFDAIKNELINSGAATAVSKTSFSVTNDGSSGGGFNWGDMNEAHLQTVFHNFATTGDLVKTFGFKLIAGRDINFDQYPADTASIIINKTSAQIMGIKNPVGQVVKRNNEPLRIVGVIDDFIIGSPYEDVKPMVIFGSKKRFYNTLTFKLSAQKPVAASLAKAEAIFKKYNPAYPFQYTFVDQLYDAKFKDGQRASTIALIFASLTIFISCLGLFGLAAYMAENRAKEISIRKVLGASVASVMQLLTREFVALVGIAIIIASPLGWWLMQKWLQNYPYHVKLEWTAFLYAGVFAVLIAIITVSFQAGKAAIANPVKSIKAE